MRVKILKYSAVALWRWDLPENDICGICRVQFDGACPTSRYPGDDCPLVNGRCGHSFHLHCLTGWLNTETSCGLCPMCRRKFHY